MEAIHIIQHNINTWHNKRYELYNTYRHLTPDIILLNDIGNTTSPIRLQGFNVYQRKSNNNVHGGTAIAIKRSIPHTIEDKFITDLIAVTIDTRQGPITIATDYIPPVVQTLNTVDYNSLFMRQNPVYLLADLNAKHPIFDHNYRNPIGDALNNLYMQNKIHHIGPHFPTFYRTDCGSTPDIVLGNHRTFHNIHLTPGPATSSDHIPIIAKITANPIQIPIRPRKQFAKTDWDKYSDELKNKNITLPTNPTTSEIDSAIADWTNLLTEVADKYTPTLEFRVLPGPRRNNAIKTLQM